MSLLGKIANQTVASTGRKSRLGKGDGEFGLNELKLGDWEASQWRNLQAPGHFNLIPRREVKAKSRDVGVISIKARILRYRFHIKIVFSYYSNFFLKIIMQKLEV